MAEKTKLRRWKTEAELTDDELLAVVQHRNRQPGEEPPRFETTAYKEARRKVLEDAGLEEEGDDPTPTPEQSEPEGMSVEEHVERIQRERSSA